MLYEHFKPVHGFINERIITGIRHRKIDNKFFIKDDTGNEFTISAEDYNELLRKGGNRVLMATNKNELRKTLEEELRNVNEALDHERIKIETYNINNPDSERPIGKIEERLRNQLDLMEHKLCFKFLTDKRNLIVRIMEVCIKRNRF